MVPAPGERVTYFPMRRGDNGPAEIGAVVVRSHPESDWAVILKDGTKVPVTVKLTSIAACLAPQIEVAR